MKNRFLFGLLIMILCVGTFAFIYGCGSSPTTGESPTSGGRLYYGITSMGDTVKFTITNTTFTANVIAGSNEGLSFSGNITTLESGLLSAEVTYSNDPAKVEVGEVNYALEKKGESLITGGGDPGFGVVMIAPALTNIAPSNGSYQAVMIPWSGWDDFPYAAATMELTGKPTYQYNMNIFGVDGSPIKITSESGYHFTASRLYKNIYLPQIFVSPRGMYVGTNGSGESGWIDGGFVGTMYDSSIATSTLTNNRVYKGISFTRDLSDNSSDIEPIIVTTEASGTKCYVYKMNVSTGATEDARAVFTLGTIGTTGKGIIDGTADLLGDTGPFQMVAYQYDIANDKYALSGFTTAEGDKAVSFFVIQP